jgi:beta-lactamase regulating signal transducer with metallopeptidase domain
LRPPNRPESLVVPRSGIPTESPQTVAAARSIDWRAVLALVSGLGTLTFLWLSIKQVWRLRGALAQYTSKDDQRLRRIAQQSAQRMGLAAQPEVSTVSANVSPLLWVRRSGPLVVIPRRLVDQMSDEQLRCVVSHEIAHYVRRDHWTNQLSWLVAALCWWNPVVWWARRELRTAQEACCDALVIGRSVATRREYAETLFQALEFVQAEGSLSPALASGFGGKSSTRRRFEMIANPRVNHRLSWWSYPLLVAALAGLLCVPVRGQPDEPKESEARKGTRPFNAAADDKHGELDRILKSLWLDSGEDYEGYLLREMTGSKRDARKTRYRLPDYLPAAHGNAVSAGGNRYYGLTPNGSDRIWHVHYYQDTADGFGKTLWDATLKLPPEGELKQGDAFVLNTSSGIVTVAVVEDDYDNDRDIGVKQIDVKTGAINDERTLLRHMARYQTFLESMQGEDDKAKENKDKSAPKDAGKADSGKADSGKQDVDGQSPPMDYEVWYRTLGPGRLDVNFPPLMGYEKWNRTFALKKLDFDFPPLTDYQGWLNYDFPHGKWAGNDLILERLPADGSNLFDSALEFWRRFRGDAPVEQIHATWQDGKVRIIIKGKISGRPSGHAEENEYRD